MVRRLRNDSLESGLHCFVWNDVDGVDCKASSADPECCSFRGNAEGDGASDVDSPSSIGVSFMVYDD